MSKPFYVDLPEACKVLEDMGICLSEKQVKRAAEPDASGNRKLPFFVDPIDGRLKIDRNTLVTIYLSRQVAAERGSTLSL
ncbi:hypothetical protein [Pyruvatibacter mobilis]|uniref:hypothetical protein n=1 Tax=Pyruvatibacter mobilis TaxID=1712261 RepID=UPI003BADA327